MRHTLNGTVYVQDASKAEEKAHDAARTYFGERLYQLLITVTEHRTLDDEVIAYEVHYTAYGIDEA